MRAFSVGSKVPTSDVLERCSVTWISVLVNSWANAYIKAVSCKASVLMSRKSYAAVMMAPLISLELYLLITAAPSQPVATNRSTAGSFSSSINLNQESMNFNNALAAALSFVRNTKLLPEKYASCKVEIKVAKTKSICTNHNNMLDRWMKFASAQRCMLMVAERLNRVQALTRLSLLGVDSRRSRLQWADSAVTRLTAGLSGNG